jgi:hypothetical protein
VVVASVDYLSRSTRNFATAAVRDYRSGLLLAPENMQQSYGLFNVKLPQSAVFSRPAGRGYLIQASQSVLVQVPEANGSW